MRPTEKRPDYPFIRDSKQKPDKKAVVKFGQRLKRKR